MNIQKINLSFLIHMNKIKLYLSKLDFVDEYISIRLQRIRYLYDSHLKYQRRYQYGKAFIRTVLGIGIMISQAQVLHQSTFSIYRPYDLCAELLYDAQNNETRIFHAIDDVLSKGNKIGELDALSYLTMGTLFVTDSILYGTFERSQEGVCKF
ncbi:hypothetical protein pb186bvf_012588 [Paramecium bursaria]